MKRLSLLTVGHSYVLAGNRSVMRKVAEDDNFNVTVCAPRSFKGDFGDVECEPEPSGSRLKVVPVSTYWTEHIHIFRYSAKELLALMKKYRFDAIHAWEEPYILAGYQIARLARKTKTPFSFWTFQNINKRLPPPFNYFERACVRTAAEWVAAGNTVYSNALERGYPPKNGRVIPLAVNTSLFTSIPEKERESRRRELGLSKPVIGFLGRLVPAKGLRVLMEALEALDPDLPWSLLVLGGGELQSEIENWAKRRGWQGRVHIHLARQEDVPRYLALVDVLVAPSQTMRNWKEQFGRMLIEAFACGVPVIASDSGEIPHVVGDAGMIVPEKDVPAWTAAIHRMLRDTELRSRLRQSQISRVQQFSVPQVAEQFKSCYQSLAMAK